uniref:Uncharacterized protein n=1 Tax=Panagrolaimus superbus TaxID=310955 RepID=A0A914YWJ1_9BILA
MQAVIIERLNKFEAVDDRQYFQEYERYKTSLNQKYSLCLHCQEYTNRKLQSINERYIPRLESSVEKLLLLNPFAIARDTLPSFSSSSLISESSSFAQSVFSESRRAPSMCSFSSSRAPSPFGQRNLAPSFFSEPIHSHTFIQSSSESPSSIASGFPDKTSLSRIPSVLKHEQHSFQKLNHIHKNQRQKLYFASGKNTVACNILTLIISFILFITFFDSSQISSNVRFLALEEYLSMDTVNALHICTNYASIIAAFTSALFYYGFNLSKVD